MACHLCGAKALFTRFNASLTLNIKFNEIWIKSRRFSFKKIYMKMSSAKCRPFRLDVNVLDYWYIFYLCRWHAGSVRYRALSIYRGHFSLNSSRKTPHSSPVRAMYGLSCVRAKFVRSFVTVTVGSWAPSCCIWPRYIDNVYIGPYHKGNWLYNPFTKSITSKRQPSKYRVYQNFVRFYHINIFRHDILYAHI